MTYRCTHWVVKWRGVTLRLLHLEDATSRSDRLASIELDVNTTPGHRTRRLQLVEQVPATCERTAKLIHFIIVP